jgi:hypothetical protein
MPDLTRDLLTAITLALSCRDPAAGMRILEGAVDLAIRQQPILLPPSLMTAEWRRLRDAERPPPVINTDDHTLDDWLEYLNTGR